MTLKIYGVAASRAARPLWAAEEMSLTYEHIDLPFLNGGTRTPAFLALNPNGRIPVVDDDGVLVWESMACLLYLVERFRDAKTDQIVVLAATCHAEQAEILRWSFWAVTECEKDALTFLMHAKFMPPERRKAHLAEEAEQRLRLPFAVLEQHLQTRTYLAATRFTAADIAVASVIAWTQGSTGLMAKYPMVADWLARCLARPAYLNVQLMATASKSI